jgi:RNA polymerase sigma factor (sigma-70 family)
MVKQTDVECVQAIQTHHDPDALKLLVTRHSGIYLDMIHKMMPSGHDNITKRELISEKDSFIYECALDFNPRIPIKFSTYIGNRIKWRCLNIYNSQKRRPHDPLESAPKLSDSFSDLHEDVEIAELQELIDKVLKNYPDKRAKRIFRLRYIDGQKNKVMPWRKIAKRLDMSIQGCINIHNKLIQTIKTKYEQGNP